MMVRIGGEYLPIKQTRVRFSGSWRKPAATWLKFGGAWKQLVPEHVVMMYYVPGSGFSLPALARLCNGSNGTPNLDKLYVNVNSSRTCLATGGADTHAGSAHGAGSMESTSVSAFLRADNPIGIYSGDDVFLPASRASHAHGFTSTHTHPNIGDVRPPSHPLRPYIGLPYIAPGAIVFGNLSAAGLLQALQLYYIYLSTSLNSSTVIGSTGHNHGSVTTTTNTVTHTPTESAPDNSSYQIGHYHTVTHTDMTEVNNPPVEPLKANRVLVKCFLNDLPTGSILAVLSDDVPEGWELVQIGDDRLLAGEKYSSGSTYRDHIHFDGIYRSHSQSFHATGTTKYRATSGSAFERYYVGTHSHTWADRAHSVPVTSMPRHICLHLIRKIS
jgi:hypothetical protein